MLRHLDSVRLDVLVFMGLYCVLLFHKRNMPLDFNDFQARKLTSASRYCLVFRFLNIAVMF